MEIQILSFNFLLFTFSGLWRPVQWSSKLSKLLYSVYTFVTIYLFIYIFLVHLMYIIFVVENIEDLAASSFLILSIIGVIVKMFNILIYRKQIINLIEILQEAPCKPCNEEEINIQLKFDHLIRSYSMQYTILCSISGVSCVVGGTLYMIDDQIPYGLTWVPWDCTSFPVFFFTCLQVIVGILIAIYVNAAMETTVLGICLQICARFEILAHRLRKMIKHNEKDSSLLSSLNNTSNKTSRLSEHVFHHLHIIRLAEMTNNTFSLVIFVQFNVSILVICSVIFHLSSRMTFIDVATLTAYVGCMFLQIFYYCWAGNEVTIKSIGFGDEIYNMDWVLMTNNEQKDLLMIMKRSTKPIKFTSSFLVTMSLESYSNLLKASFSAFNLMQQL